MKEIGKETGYPFYQVSNLGRVRSLNRKIKHFRGSLRNWKGRILKPTKYTNGYYAVCFGFNGKRDSVHRLVAKAFIPNPKDKPCVNHRDGNRTNNIVSNLAWVTYAENEQWSYKVLGKKPNNPFKNFIRKNA